MIAPATRGVLIAFIKPGAQLSVRYSTWCRHPSICRPSFTMRSRCAVSDRTSSPYGMRRPWMVIGLVGGSLGILIVALAPNITILLVGWCIAQLLFNALLAAMVAVLPDQVPIGQRGLVSGILGVGMPIASVSATFLVKLFTGNQLAMFLVPCAIAGCFILFFVVTLNDRRLASDPASRAN